MTTCLSTSEGTSKIPYITLAGLYSLEDTVMSKILYDDHRTDTKSISPYQIHSWFPQEKRRQIPHAHGTIVTISQLNWFYQIAHQQYIYS